MTEHEFEWYFYIGAWHHTYSNRNYTNAIAGKRHLTLAGD